MKQKTRNRDMWKNIPWQRRNEIAEQISVMPDGIRKQILTMAFVDGMSTADIARYAESTGTLMSRNHRPISKRRVLQIIAEEVPDYNAYQKRGRCRHRKEHLAFIAEREKERCGNCGTKSNLEWHHMIPLCMGGKTDAENMICLCAECHEAISAYHRKTYPEFFKK